MGFHTRRSVLRYISMLGIGTAAGCSGTFSKSSEKSVQYALDGVYLENANASSISFGLKIYDGDELLFDEGVELEGMENGETDHVTIEKPWMEEKGRYGVEVETSEGETVSLSLSDVLDRWDDSVHEYEFIEYAIIHRSDNTFGIYPDFYDETRTA